DDSGAHGEAARRSARAGARRRAGSARGAGEAGGEAEVILEKPAGAWAMLALAHGAGAGMRHPFLEKLAAALSAEGVATLRYEFPYMAANQRRIDPAPVLEARVREAVEGARLHGLPLFAGGKSMGGRITSQAQ